MFPMITTRRRFQDLLNVLEPGEYNLYSMFRYNRQGTQGTYSFELYKDNGFAARNPLERLCVIKNELVYELYPRAQEIVRANEDVVLTLIKQAGVAVDYSMFHLLTAAEAMAPLQA